MGKRTRENSVGDHSSDSYKRTRSMDDDDREQDIVAQRYRLINNLLSTLNKERKERIETLTTVKAF